jgi:hypothetical protein
MIVELVTFKAPPGADWDAILAGARATVPHWRANPDLVRKHWPRRPRMMRPGAPASSSAPVRRR